MIIPRLNVKSYVTFDMKYGNVNCAPLLADLLLYSYENEFLDKLIKVTVPNFDH